MYESSYCYSLDICPTDSVQCSLDSSGNVLSAMLQHNGSILAEKLGIYWLDEVVGKANS